MKLISRLACLALLSAPLAACGQEKTSDKASAGGEILPGSASDAMLPLDTVQSQPPLAPPPTESARKGVGGSGDPDAAASDAADDAEPAAGASTAPSAAPPAATPTPE